MSINSLGLKVLKENLWLDILKEVECQYGHQMNLTTNVKQLVSQPWT